LSGEYKVPKSLS